MRSLFIRCLAFVILLGLVAGGGCSSRGGTTTTLGPGVLPGTPTTAPDGESPQDVTLAVAAEPFSNLDPAGASTTGDILLLHQVYDRLVEEDGEGGFKPGLAASWGESASTGWTFTLRPNVVFHDGTTLDAEDVVFTFERLRELALDPVPGLEGAAPFSVISSVIALTPERVLFVLTEHDPEFPALVAGDAASVLSSMTVNPSREWVGTGPFVLWSYVPGGGAVLKRSAAYWGRDAGGRLLPYLDGLDIVFGSAPGSAAADLESGRVGFAGGLGIAQAEEAGAVEGVSIARTVSNDHPSILLRALPGSPLADPDVRRALKIATDREKLAEAVRGDAAVPGNDSPVGPYYGRLHLAWDPLVDAETALVLLAGAGYPEGLSLELAVGDAAEATVLATAWKDQMAAIGVVVNIVKELSVVPAAPAPTPPGEGEGTGTTGGPAEAGAPAQAEIVWSSTEASPRSLLFDRCRVGPPEEGAVWQDEEFGEALALISGAEGGEGLLEAYHLAQEILRDRGPLIVPYYQTSLTGLDSRLTGVSPAAYWPRTSFRSAAFSAGG